MGSLIMKMKRVGRGSTCEEEGGEEAYVTKLSLTWPYVKCTRDPADRVGEGKKGGDAYVYVIEGVMWREQKRRRTAATT